jgi:hypothetical protein
LMFTMLNYKTIKYHFRVIQWLRIFTCIPRCDPNKHKQLLRRIIPIFDNIANGLLLLVVRLMWITVQLGTPRGRYDEYSSKVFPQ